MLALIQQDPEWNNGKLKKATLVVAPKSNCERWASEVNKFIPNAKVKTDVVNEPMLNTLFRLHYY
jgi:SNF2 family DNA or RNA helicase